MKNCFWAISIVFLLLPGNGNGWAKQPDWVMDQSEKWPQRLYLVGVGQADSREGAEAEARAAIAKIFHARIRQETEQWQKYLEVESRGKTQVEQKQAIESVTAVSTEKVLEGVEIVERAQDGPLYYALAVMDRLQSTTRLTEQITALNRTIDNMLHLARTSPDKLTRITNFKKGIKTLLLRDAYNADLMIVNVKGEGVPSAVSPLDAVQEFETWLSKNFLIDVEIAGPHHEVVKEVIIEALLRDRFPVKGEEKGRENPASKPDLLIKGEVALSPSHLPNQPFVYVRWCVDLTVLETAGNRIVGVVTKSGREGHLSEAEATARAIRSLQPQISSGMVASLSEYFTGEFKSVENRPSACAKK